MLLQTGKVWQGHLKTNRGISQLEKLRLREIKGLAKTAQEFATAPSVPSTDWLHNTNTGQPVADQAGLGLAPAVPWFVPAGAPLISLKTFDPAQDAPVPFPSWVYRRSLIFWVTKSPVLFSIKIFRFYSV